VPAAATGKRKWLSIPYILNSIHTTRPDFKSSRRKGFIFATFCVMARHILLQQTPDVSAATQKPIFRLLPAQRNHLSATVPHFYSFLSWLFGKLTTASWDRRQEQRTALSRHGRGDKNVRSLTLLFRRLIQNFILVGCILLRNVYITLSDIYLHRNWEIFYWCYPSLFHNMFRTFRFRAILKWITIY
jgi:hypothetical protein